MPASTRPAPRWAHAAAWASVACVTPSAIWRTAVGVGIDLGWSADQLERQHLPGTGTVYVITLSAASLVGAALTLRLVRPDGDLVPGWVPVLGGRRVPVPVVVAVSLAGALVVGWVAMMSVRSWDQVSGFADQPGSRWALLMAACYAPALLWAPLLLAVTASYARRNARSGRPSRVAGGRADDAQPTGATTSGT